MPAPYWLQGIRGQQWLSSAAILIGDNPHLPREVWARFVQSGLVEHKLTFYSVNDIVDALEADGDTTGLNIKLIFIMVAIAEDLFAPIDLNFTLPCQKF